MRAVVWTVASVLLLLTAAAEPVVAAQDASGRSSGVDVDLGVLDSLGPPPSGAPDGNKPAQKAPARPHRGETPAAGGHVPVLKPAAVPPPPKLPPPMPATKSTANPEQPAPAGTTAAKPADTAAAPPTAESAPPAKPAASQPAAPASARPKAVTTEQITFGPGDSTLSEQAREQLAPLIAQLSSNDRLHVDLLGYAAGGNDQSQARRLSLARALAVRVYLVEQGIPSTRVDVRALGNRSDAGAAGPADRVDVLAAERPVP